MRPPVLGGLAVASAVSRVLWLSSALSLRTALEQSCAPNCSEQQVAPLRSRVLISNLSRGASGAALVGAGLFLLLRPELPVDASVSWPSGGFCALGGTAF